MEILFKVWDWVVYSSKNPEKFSLTLKGLIPLLVLLNVGDQIQLEGLADTIAHFAVVASEAILAGISVWGALRKILYTIYSPKVD